MNYDKMISSKLPKVGQSIFSVMSAMANQHGAINLAQGFPDFNCPEVLMEQFNYHMHEGRNQYAPMPGVPVLKEKLADKIQKLYKLKVDPAAEITITAGATQAISMIISAAVNAGDEVIIFEPAYDSYLPSIELNRGVTRFVQLNSKDFSIDWQDVKSKISSKTKLIIINNPHNPSGAIFAENDIAELRKVVDGTDIMILSDEVYEHIVFDGNQHLSICKYPELAARTFVVSSFGKTYHNTGWKMGYVLAPAPLTTEFRKVFSYGMFSALTPAQYALADILEFEDLYLGLGDFYQKKRDIFLKAIDGSGFKPIPCKGTYFQCVDYSSISDQNDLEFATFLTKEIGVAAIPTSAFYQNKQDNKILRFCFAKGEETLISAGEKLKNI